MEAHPSLCRLNKNRERRCDTPKCRVCFIVRLCVQTGHSPQMTQVQTKDSLFLETNSLHWLRDSRCAKSEHVYSENKTKFASFALVLEPSGWGGGMTCSCGAHTAAGKP